MIKEQLVECDSTNIRSTIQSKQFQNQLQVQVSNVEKDLVYVKGNYLF